MRCSRDGLKAVLTLLVVLGLSSCARDHGLLPNTEFVLIKDMKISATTPNGSVTITGGAGTGRTYRGEG
jgi:hypothetical protein